MKNIFTKRNLVFLAVALFACCSFLLVGSLFIPDSTPTSTPEIEVTEELESEGEEIYTSTPRATVTSIPTVTSFSTVTPAPSATSSSTPNPTSTTRSTNTPRPTNTFIPPTLVPPTVAPTVEVIPTQSIVTNTPLPAPPTNTPLPPPTETPVQERVRTGAQCNDGTTSDATGRGACSSHDGVKCWFYNDGTCTKP